MSGNDKVKWQQFIVHHVTIGGFLNNVVIMKHVEVTNVRVNRTYYIEEPCGCIYKYDDESMKIGWKLYEMCINCLSEVI